MTARMTKRAVESVMLTCQEGGDIFTSKINGDTSRILTQKQNTCSFTSQDYTNQKIVYSRPYDGNYQTKVVAKVISRFYRNLMC